METATTFGHVSGLGIYERPSPEFDPYQVVYERFGALVGQAEPMRRKLVEVPFSLDHPWWIDDADFDLDYHVRHIGLAPPGGVDQLGEQVSRIVGRLAPGSVVTTQKNTVDNVVTEHGIAALRGCSVRERAQRLIAIAAPEWRDDLTRQARELGYL